MPKYSLKTGVNCWFARTVHNKQKNFQIRQCQRIDEQ